VRRRVTSGRVGRGVVRGASRAHRQSSRGAQ
jgi:hypothetical protein